MSRREHYPKLPAIRKPGRPPTPAKVVRNREIALRVILCSIAGAMVGALIGLAFRHTQIAATESVRDS